MSRFALRRSPSSFLRARGGATAIEFAILAMPMLILVFGIIELALVFMVSTTLQNATDSASRQIRTGEFQTGGASTKIDFQNLVCANMSWLQADCATRLSLDVRTFASFAGLNGSAPVDPTAYNPAANQFCTPQPSQIVLVRAYYNWDIITPLLDASLVNRGAGSGKRLISATVSFRSEPFPPGSSTCP